MNPIHLKAVNNLQQGQNTLGDFQDNGLAYNHLNLPRQITFGPQDNIQYAYTATGAKLRKTVNTMKTTTGSVTDYCGNFIYADNQLITIFAGDVRVAPVNVGNSTYWKYEYSMKDHLGNTRVVFAAHSHGQPELLQQTSYYPFGMTMQQQNFYSQNATENKYLYNGKELQDDQLAGNTLDWYDYGWRMYDAVLGRFHTQDRFSENYYSLSNYSYGANNPVLIIDVNGDSLWINYKGSNILYENGNLYNNDGKAYTGKGVKTDKNGNVTGYKGFLGQTMNALGIISGTAEGGAMVTELQSSINNFTIEKGPSEFRRDDTYKAYANQFQTDPSYTATYNILLASGVNFAGGSGGRISWNPLGSSLPIVGGTGINAATDLAHEMFHGLDANRGLLDDRQHLDPRINRSDWQAVYRENTLRAQLGVPLRTHYISVQSPSGVVTGGDGPSMITPANAPILPPWYLP